MSLLDEALAAQAHVGPQCVVSTLAPDLIAEINEALAEPGLYATTIARILKEKRGVTVTDETLRRHKRQECQCPR